MSEELLERLGLHIDNFNKLRLIQPELGDSSEQLCDDIKNFSGTVTTFQTKAKGTIDALNDFAKKINEEKIAAMNLQHAIKSNDSSVVDDVQRLEIVIRERQIELERLRTELEAMQREEEEQKEYLQKLISKK